MSNDDKATHIDYRVSAEKKVADDGGNEWTCEDKVEATVHDKAFADALVALLHEHGFWVFMRRCTEVDVVRDPESVEPESEEPEEPPP